MTEHYKNEIKGPEGHPFAEGVALIWREDGTLKLRVKDTPIRVDQLHLRGKEGAIVISRPKQ